MQTTKCATNRFKWTNPKHGVLVYRENIGKLLNSVTDIHKLLRSLLQGGGSGGVGEWETWQHPYLTVQVVLNHFLTRLVKWYVG